MVVKAVLKDLADAHMETLSKMLNILTVTIHVHRETPEIIKFGALPL